MWIQCAVTCLMAVCCMALARPIPKPTPISVYQQEDIDEQDQLQYRQPVQYKQQVVQPHRPSAGAAGRQQLLRQQQNPQLLQQTESEDYEMGPPQPYKFSFDVNDDENTNYQNRKEEREGNKISGSYSVVDSDGFIRTVTYTADPVEGFKAHVSREPTNIVVKLPTPHQPEQEQFPAAQYTAGQGSKQLGIQYNGAPAQRPQVLRPQTQARRQQTQQYLQGSQDTDAYQPAYQSQGTVRVSQAISQGGQVNQYLQQTSPQASHVNQFSNSNTQIRG